MTEERRRLGLRAEAKALRHLEGAGLELVAKNWKANPRPGQGGHGGELDLVMRDGDVLVFVEVRAKSTSFAGGAPYSVGHAKRQQVARLAQIFLLTHPSAPRRMRFDVVALTRSGLIGWDVRWYKNAFSV